MSKMLLRPRIIEKQAIIQDQAEMPFLKLNDRVFKDVFQWLNDSGYKDVSKQLISEYNTMKDYMSGRTSESTIDLHPSSLYTKQFKIEESIANRPIHSILRGIVTPDTEIMLRSWGIGMSDGDIVRRQDGEFNLRKIRNSFNKWSEKKLDEKIGGC